jgi:hypothetical protein
MHSIDKHIEESGTVGNQRSRRLKCFMFDGELRCGCLLKPAPTIITISNKTGRGLGDAEGVVAVHYLTVEGFTAAHIGLCRMPLTPFRRFLPIPMLLILRQMWFSEFSVKLRRLCPSLVSW